MELNAFRAVFGRADLPVYGVKGALGHTLGAAGAIETVIALRALAEGVVPGTVGFKDPDPAASGMVHAGTGAAARARPAAHQLGIRRRQCGPGARREAGVRVFVTGIGWAGAAGMGTGRGATAFALPAGELPPISRRDVFPEPDSRFGRLDAFSRLALAGVALALRDAGIETMDRTARGRDRGLDDLRLHGHRPGLPGHPRRRSRARQPAACSPTPCRTSFSAKRRSASV